jgi:hypothetical protein
MMTWEYRVFQEANGDYIIREVFYDDQGNITACTQDAVEPMGNSLRALTEDLAAFQAALKLPVLTLEDIPKQTPLDHRSSLTGNISHDQVLNLLGID